MNTREHQTLRMIAAYGDRGTMALDRGMRKHDLDALAAVGYLDVIDRRYYITDNGRQALETVSIDHAERGKKVKRAVSGARLVVASYNALSDELRHMRPVADGDALAIDVLKRKCIELAAASSELARRLNAVRDFDYQNENQLDMWKRE